MADLASDHCSKGLPVSVRDVSYNSQVVDAVAGCLATCDTDDNHKWRISLIIHLCVSTMAVIVIKCPSSL